MFISKPPPQYVHVNYVGTGISKRLLIDVDVLRRKPTFSEAIAAAYGWDDLKLDHGFHETKQGVRYTISEPARREVLARLLKLNHERHAEEVKQGMHEKKGAAKKAKSPKTVGNSVKPEATLFDGREEE